MKKVTILLAVLTAIVSSAYADNFRCPNGSIVSSGDSVSEVIVKCDTPTNKVKRVDSEIVNGGVRNTEIEEWTYNEGLHTLVHYLIFRNGTLTEIKTGTFGR
jgi:hypothetical protein